MHHRYYLHSMGDVSTVKAEQRPIGYWLKELDGRLERDFERGLAGDGLLRRHWQVLNGLRQGGTTREAIATWPFWTEGDVTLDEVIDELTGRGWVERDGAALRLTPAGEEAHARVSDRVTALRHLLLKNITEDEYVATVRVLKRMVDNLA
jgi:hypothetical protein